VDGLVIVVVFECGLILGLWNNPKCLVNDWKVFGNSVSFHFFRLPSKTFGFARALFLDSRLQSPLTNTTEANGGE